MKLNLKGLKGEILKKESILEKRIEDDNLLMYLFSAETIADIDFDSFSISELEASQEFLKKKYHDLETGYYKRQSLIRDLKRLERSRFKKKYIL